MDIPADEEVLVEPVHMQCDAPSNTRGVPRRVCTHGKKIPSLCIECCPANFCPTHGRNIAWCGICALSPLICQHHRRKYRCTECALNNESTGTSVCKHNKRRYQCVDCFNDGVLGPKSQFCICGIRKENCTLHGATSLCTHCKTTRKQPKSDWCAPCRFIVSKDTPRNIKRREIEILEWLQQVLPFSYHNKSVDRILQMENTTLKTEQRPTETQQSGEQVSVSEPVEDKRVYFPDFVWVLNDRFVVLEIDEFQHRDPSYNNDHEREVAITHKFLQTGKSVIIIRYNPDAFETGFKKRSVYLASSTAKHLRYKLLLETLHEAMRCECNESMIVYSRLFYDCKCTSIETCNFRHNSIFNSFDEFSTPHH